MNKLTFLFLAFLFSYSLQSQEIAQSKQSFLDDYRSIKVADNLNHNNFFDSHSAEMGLDEDNEFRLVHTEEGRNGYTHYKYQQYYNKVAVYGTTYLLHENDGKLVSANGHYLPKIDISTRPLITEEHALAKAMQDMAAEQYTWETETASPRSTQQKPSLELVVIDNKMPNFSAHYSLAYTLELRSQVPFDAQTYFIDATSGRVIKKISLLKGIGVPGKGVTKYYGEREFIVDSVGPTEFVLRDPTRCADGINIFNDGQGIFTSTSSTFDLQNEDQDEVALDAHFMTSEFYDRLRDEFDWLGLDNENGSMNVSVHARGGQDFINAFWDGEFAWFGDGDCNNGPLVTLEVLAHEFMHGIIDYTSELIYSDESGAINESLADVMGHYMENEIDPDNFSWTLGNSFALVDGLEPFRVMDDPAAVGNPEYYKGPLWEDGADVHYNSSLGNLVYVVLSDGKTGVNLDGDAYEVTAMGRTEAAKFLFYVNRNYLTASSNYNDYYLSCLLASDEYFPGDVDMKKNIEQAWLSVGIPYEFVGGDEMNISISSTGFQESCDWGKFAPAEFTITNSGSVPYLGSSGGYVEVDADISGTNFNRMVNLTENILPGESQSFTIDSFLILTEDFFFVDYELEIQGDNEGDASSFDYYFVTEYAESDFTVSVSSSELTCFRESYEMTFFVTNESCTVIEAGQVVKLILSDEFSGEEVWSEEIVIENALFPGAAERVVRDIDLDITETTFYLVSLENDEDPNDENNVSFTSVPVLEPLAINYYNGFNTEADLFSNGLGVETSSFGSNLTPYNGSNQFFTTGFLDEISAPLCMDPEDNWNGSTVSLFGNISAEISACLDLDGATNPAVHFNMTHFRNDFSNFASSNTSSVRLTTVQEGGEETYQIIAGLPEEVTEEFTIPLPADFKGSMKMTFLTQSGTDVFAQDFLLYDVVFLDNLELIDVSDTEELTRDTPIALYPNPVTDILNFSSDLQFVEVSVYDVSGIQVSTQKGSRNIPSLDVSILDAGYYVVKFKSKQGEKYQGKFIKI